MIGDLTSIARPYAVAAFEYAESKKAIAAWEDMLNSAALIVNQKGMEPFLNSPQMTSPLLAQFFDDVLAKIMNEEQKNFIHLLALNKRLHAIPDIAELFKQYRFEHEKRVNVQVISAIKLDDNFKLQLENSLAKKLKRHVSLQCEVDASLLGGAILRAYDTVIDGSVRGKLNRLLESL